LAESPTGGWKSGAAISLYRCGRSWSCEAALEDYLLMVTSIKLDDMSKIYYLFDTS